MKQLKIIALLGLLALALAACTGNNEPDDAYTPTRTTTDRAGNAINLPSDINTIVTLAPANAEIIVALGLGDKIIATDSFSADVAGLGAGVPRAFGITDFDVEYITELMPDVLFASMVRIPGTDDPLAALIDVGITVIYMPVSNSIGAIMDDIRFIAYVLDAVDAGNEVIANMQEVIDDVKQIAAGITETRTVYFEVSPPPWLTSLGTGTFIHDMIELVGATNIFEDEFGWVSVSEEILVELNPDIILTSEGFLDDPILEIISRPGFDAITAVQNDAVFRIDTNASSRPGPNIVIALRQIAEAVFPEYFQ